MIQANYYAYWGKAKRDETIQGEPYHLLVYHSLDVAAVAKVLLQKHPLLRQRLAALMQLTEEQASRWCVFLLGIHDLGKFADSFQQLRFDLRQQLWANERINKKYYTIRHDSLGEMLWKQTLKRSCFTEDNESISEFAEDTFNIWLKAVVGHHGKPPTATERVKRHFTNFDQQAAGDYFQAWRQLCPPDFAQAAHYDEYDETWAEQQKKASWLLAGIAVLCDWLGSDQTIFTYQTEVCSLHDYWHNTALPAAEKAIHHAGILTKAINTHPSLQHLFPFITTPTPLQQQCLDIPIEQQPQLFILEDVTGAGKTEAALILTQRLMSKGQAQGVYIGLPTMATANAMYSRMSNSYQQLYQKRVKPSLILSHSARHLSEIFQQSLLNSHQEEQSYANEENITAQCNRWLADNRKKALLADVGIGTIDQALLAILPVRHQSLRLLGLSNKVLILDEVHAYDAYTNQLLKRLVSFHAALGGSVILLSATLTYKQRNDLLQAFYGQASIPHNDDQEDVIKQQVPYPLLTYASMSSMLTQRPQEYPLATREAVKRHVNVVFSHQQHDVLNTIKTAIQLGKCVCWIRNTVFDARQAWQQLQACHWITDDKLHLFHSRYALHDRLQIEDKMLALFGKDSTSEQRYARVLIATQVVEQSLDLDFDVMISDLAPIDLLIQRAGRLQRHNRDPQGTRLAHDEDDQRGIATLHVFTPPLTTTPDKDWFKNVFPKADFVYSHTLILWRTCQLLNKTKGWQMPDDARQLLEYVYDEAGEIPKGLEEDDCEAQGDTMAQTDTGIFNALRLRSGYSHTQQPWDEDAQVMTRLGEDTQTLYLARWQQGCLTPWVEAGDYPWDLSSLRVNKQFTHVDIANHDSELAMQLAVLKQQTSLFTSDSLILPLQKITDNDWQGRVYNNDNKRFFTINYQAHVGLAVICE